MPDPGFERIRLETVGSTQDEARSLVRAGARSGTVVIADTQTAGRGRGDHSWSSAAGLGLWLTAIHRSQRPVREWPILTSASALAVCEAIEELGLTPRIRWPNDILIKERKVCGILAETEGDAVLLGIGVNVSHRVEDFPPELKGTATSLAIEIGSVEGGALHPEEFLERLLPRLSTILGSLECTGAGSFIPRVWERSVVRGRHVEVIVNDLAGMDTVSGEAIGLNDIGGLIVRGPRGVVEVVSGALREMGREES